jgi:hypothetical protein
MSALPPKPDLAEVEEHVRFVPKADMPSFEERVGTSQECFWDSEAYGLRAFEVNSELKLRRLLYR